MITLKWQDEAYQPRYQTEYSAGADLRSRKDIVCKSHESIVVPTGVFIQDVNWEQVPQGYVPELQVRMRSGLAFKHQLTLTNGVGTIDADYRDEICVLITNLGIHDYFITKGMRIAQIVLNLVKRMDGIPVGGERIGGFGSTGVN